MSIYTCLCGDYEFYCIYHSVSTQVYPLNFINTMLVDELEGTLPFYRRVFNGVLIFNNVDDWTYFKNLHDNDDCGRIDFVIYKDSAIYWEGYFSISDGEIDFDSCTFSVQPILEDEYTDLLAKADEEVNIIAEITTEVTTTNDMSHRAVVDTAYTHNRWLYNPPNDNIIQVLAEHIAGATVTVSSDFFSAAINPAYNDYNHYTLLTLAQVTDIKYPTASNPATIALLSWNQLMEILWAMFQVTWDYDVDTDTINVEHISWFNKVDGIDVRSQKIARGMNKYHFDKGNMPKYEKFRFMSAFNTDFVGVDIWYDSNCVNQDPKLNIRETQIPVYTDIEYYTTDLPNEGFVMFCNYLDGGNYYVKMNYGKLSDQGFRNADISWANLQDLFYRHNRVQIEGYLNNTLVDFWSTIKYKIHEFNATVCEEYDPNDLITTELGETYLAGEKGTVIRGELTPTGQLNLRLGYGEETEFTGVDDLLTAMVFSSPQDNEDATDTWTAYVLLNRPAPVGGTTVRVRVHMYDVGPVLNCSTGWESAVFAAGEYTKSVGGDLCAELADIDCVVFEIEYDDDVIEKVVADYITQDAEDLYACDTPFIYTAV